jgi:hypothetical protein
MVRLLGNPNLNSFWGKAPEHAHLHFVYLQGKSFVVA